MRAPGYHGEEYSIVTKKVQPVNSGLNQFMPSFPLLLSVFFDAVVLR